MGAMPLRTRAAGRAALQFCERITRDDLKVSEECLGQVRGHFTEAEIVE